MAQDAAIDTVDTEDPPGTQLSTPREVRGEIRREVRQFQRGPEAQPVAPAPGHRSEPGTNGETQGKREQQQTAGGRERQKGVAATPQQAPAPPPINPVFAALSVPTHEASPETQWEIAQAAAESWLSLLDPSRRQTIYHQWRSSQMQARVMGKVLESIAKARQQAAPDGGTEQGQIGIRPQQGQ